MNLLQPYQFFCLGILLWGMVHLPHNSIPSPEGLCFRHSDCCDDTVKGVLQEHRLHYSSSPSQLLRFSGLFSQWSLFSVLILIVMKNLMEVLLTLLP